MFAQLLGLLLFACQIILNGASIIREKRDSVNLPEGYVRFPDVQSAYKIHEVGTTWESARDSCISEGACLAIADSVVKIQHMKSLKTDIDSNNWLHVGIRHSSTNNEWVRVDNGLTLPSIPWAKDNPDGTGNCAGISISEDGLLDYPCDWQGEYYVCEISI